MPITCMGHLRPVYTMDHEVGPWKMTSFYASTWWSNFCGSIYFIKNLQSLWAPHLGVNQIWTKRRDCALKNEYAQKINICLKRAFLKKNQNWSFICLLLASLLFISWFHLISPWISTNMVAMKERRRLILLLDLWCFCPCL